jgi:hypothetical protein
VSSENLFQLLARNIAQNGHFVNRQISTKIAYFIRKIAHSALFQILVNHRLDKNEYLCYIPFFALE